MSYVEEYICILLTHKLVYSTNYVLFVAMSGINRMRSTLMKNVRPLRRRMVFICASLLAVMLVVGCAGDAKHEHQGRGFLLVHATDPHIFLPAAEEKKTDPDSIDKKNIGTKQQELNEKALADMLKRIRSLEDGRPPSFLVLTGDFGVDPCPIAKAELGKSPTTKECVAVDEGKRSRQIQSLAGLLSASPVRDIYLVAGNNDLANEAPDDDALGYFNKLLDDVQAQMDKNRADVQLHNLTRCYAATGNSPSSCFADLADTPYRVIGFPSYSFKNKNALPETLAAQAKQFDTFRGLLDQARQAGKKVLILTHTPEMDDPFTLAQDRYAAKPPAAANDPDPASSRSRWSTWNVSKKLLEDWQDVLASDSVAGVLAGHLHDSHKEIYRQPYFWSSVANHQLAFRKLFLAPPLAVKNQDNSPIQARGFSVLSLAPDRIKPHFYWYSSETGDFAPEHKRKFEAKRHGGWPRWHGVIAWLWQLAGPEKALEHLAVLLIAFLTAFLTVVAIWQFPLAESLLLAPGKKEGETTAPPAPEPSPFTNRFGKTVIAGLGGLVMTEVTKALGNQQPSPDTKWYYIVWFILFFFVLLLGLGALRALTEGVRARVAIVHYPLARRPGKTDNAWKAFWEMVSYWVRRILDWVFSMRVPLLTALDTFINLIQGKNPAMTQAFSETIIEQQRSVVRVADAIRYDLNRLIERGVLHLLSQESAAPPAPPVPAQVSSKDLTAFDRVRVNISVLSNDQSSVYYISRAPGSSLLPFLKRSMAWVSVYTGEIRWYLSQWDKLDANQKRVADTVVLFDNSGGDIPGEPAAPMLVRQYYQPRHQDYEAFIIFPLPWPQRGFGSDYVKGAIQISFRQDDDLRRIWKPGEIKDNKYPTPSRMLEDWCCDAEVRAAVRNSLAALGELLRGFNEVIYKHYVEVHQFE